MEQKKSNWFLGDRILWILIGIISAFSILLVYSASAQLQYNTPNGGSITSSIIKHIGIIVLGFFVMRLFSFIKYQYLSWGSVVLLVLSFLGLVWASVRGISIGGASAARWINIMGVSVQPSVFVYLALVLYLCRYLTRKITHPSKTWEDIVYVLVPIGVIFLVVAKDNGSMAVLILFVSMTVLALGKFGWKYILSFLGLAFIIIGFVVTLAKTTPILNETRVPTWISRVENYFTPTPEVKTQEYRDKNYQKDMAKAAIVNGGLFGVGIGKGVLKHQISQSVSDFIFAVVVEEYGVIGAIFLLFAYLIVLVRIMMVAFRTPDVFGVLVLTSIAIMIFMQVAVNVAVAVGLFPVTGQPLPLVSAGGTSMLVTFIQLGIVLKISSNNLMKDEEGLNKKTSIEEINDIA